jgi:hypothetical protein
MGNTPFDIRHKRVTTVTGTEGIFIDVDGDDVPQRITIDDIRPIIATPTNWGDIGGTLSSQTDLQTALNGKVSLTGNETITGNKTFNSKVAVNELTIRGAAIVDLASASYTDYDTNNNGLMRFTTSLANVDIHGFISGSVVGRTLTVANVNSSGQNTITLINQSSSNSVSANAITNNGQNIILFPSDSVTLQWRTAVIARWGVIAGSRTLKQNVILTPAQITANENNYNTSGVNQLRLDTDASRDITGFANGTNGKTLTIHNIGSNNIVLKHESSSSNANSRMILGNAGADVTILPNDSVMLAYDVTSSRWRLINKSF